MTKLIVTLFFKLSFLLKSILIFILSLFDDLLRIFNEIGFYLLHSIRSIRFEEVRDYISENFVTIILFIFLAILIYSTLDGRKKNE